MALIALSVGCCASLAQAAEPPCRVVEVSFRPTKHLQIAVWVEDAQGNYVDTIYITRLTGVLGLGNRPGLPLFKSEYRFPYGAREMVLPVWAHKRGKTYGQVVMGGALGNSPTEECGSDCRNDTIGYHFNVSSPEPFYCGPSGGAGGTYLDATSCASAFYGSKGAYATGGVSYYPPRADLVSFTPQHDGPDAVAFSTVNDLVAISGATPPGNEVIDPPLRWRAPHDGQFVIKVESSLESDFNLYYDGRELVSCGAPGWTSTPNIDDGSPGLNCFGRPFLGQPSVIYAIPVTVGDSVDVETSASYAGYGDRDGATGTFHLPDVTISTDVEGSGAGRLMMASDASGTWRVKVKASPSCDLPTSPDGGASDGGSTCQAPAAPTGLVATPGATSIALSFASASSGVAPNRFDVRYREGASPSPSPSPSIDDANFLTALPSSSPPPPPGAQGQLVTMSITGLRPETNYTVAVRALSSCDTPSPVAVTQVHTGLQKFTVLHGCFIATAAYGSPLSKELDVLRRVRDRALLPTPLGRLLVAVYYALSPPFASVIADNEPLRAATRRLIAPIVAVASEAERAVAKQSTRASGLR